MSEENNGLISLTLDNELEIIIPKENVTPYSAGYYEQRFGREKISESQLALGESAAAYAERLFELYPSPEQRTYLRTLTVVARAVSYGLWALKEYLHGRDLEEEVEGMFPRGLNNSIEGMGVKESDQEQWLVRMNTKEANEVIRTLNVGAHAVRKFGEERVKKVKQELGVAILEGDLSEGSMRQKLRLVPDLVKVNIARMLVGKELVLEEIEKTLEELVTHELLGLKTDASAGCMREVASYIHDPYNPGQLNADYLYMGNALDDMDIYPFVSAYILKAYDRELDPKLDQGEVEND
jgi:hypothetical protein